MELLETRALPAGTLVGVLAPFAETEPALPNDTLDVAQVLGTVRPGGPVVVTGAVGNAPSGAADVDWYQFELAAPARVTLGAATVSTAAAPHPTLSLYNNAPLFADPTAPFGPRLLGQSEPDAPAEGKIERVLTAGTYFVAVSGAGNRWFHPFVAASGAGGSTGGYELRVDAVAEGVAAGDGPQVLATDPPLDRPLDRAPLVIRVYLSSPFDPGSLFLFPDPELQDVRLTFNPTGDFGDGNDVPVNLIPNGFLPADELPLVPEAPLPPGFYQVFLAGDSSAHPLVLRDLAGNPLGMSANHPAGADYVTVFEIRGIEGNTSENPAGNDTADTAIDLGEITGGLIQMTGAIGDDPAYNPALWPAPTFFPPGSDVDLYHFRVRGPDNHALIAEVFAGRIGSPLDPGLTLFRRDPETGRLLLVTANDNTLNDLASTNGLVPFATDAALFSGLTAGDYYLAVSSTPNVPGSAVDPFGPPVFDPTTTRSGLGFTTGVYVLNLFLQADAEPPRVLTTTPAAGQRLDAPPTRLEVQFSEAVNLQQLAYEAARLQLPGPAAVFVRGAGGDHFARLLTLDAATNRATLLLLDPLPNGSYTLHLSGALGLADFAGNRLTGSDPAGDYVVPFEVNASPRGTPDAPRTWFGQEPNDALAEPQVLGPLFPNELADGVEIVRAPGGETGAPPRDVQDVYQFELLQRRQYLFQLSLSGVPAGVQVQVQFFDARGLLQPLPLPGDQFLLDVPPGVYRAHVWGWSADQSADVSYRLDLRLVSSAENPTPLTLGPAPAFRIRLGTVVPPRSGDPPPVVVPPPDDVAPAPGGIGPTHSGVYLAPFPGTPAHAGSGIVLTAPGPRGAAQTGRGIPSGVLGLLSAAPVGGVRAVNPAPPAAPRLALDGPAVASPLALESSSSTPTIVPLSGGDSEGGGVEANADGANAAADTPPIPSGEGLKKEKKPTLPGTPKPCAAGLQQANDWLYAFLARFLAWLVSPGLYWEADRKETPADPAESPATPGAEVGMVVVALAIPGNGRLQPRERRRRAGPAARVVVRKASRQGETV